MEDVWTNKWMMRRAVTPRVSSIHPASSIPHPAAHPGRRIATTGFLGRRKREETNIRDMANEVV